MKLAGVLLLLGLCAALSDNMVDALRYNNPASGSTSTPRVTLAQELNDIKRLIPTRTIKFLIIRYLLNDAEFQTFVRIVNSQDAYLAHRRFRSQPEVMAFITWVRSQIVLSGDDLDSDESNESLKIFNPVPFWTHNVFGWQGFVKEFRYYYPEEEIRANVQAKAALNAIFAGFVERLKNLKSAYDRVIAMPETQRLKTALETNGFATAAIDNFIRNQFGWQEGVGVTEAQ